MKEKSYNFKISEAVNVFQIFYIKGKVISLMVEIFDCLG